MMRILFNFFATATATATVTAVVVVVVACNQPPTGFTSQFILANERVMIGAI